MAIDKAKYKLLDGSHRAPARRETDVMVNEGTKCDMHSVVEDNRTVQSDRDASDVNLTIKKYNLQPDDFSRLQEGWSGRILRPFGDMTQIPTFGEMHEVLERARESFMQFPAEVRAYFGNDPARMLDAWNQGHDADVFEELGLLVRAPDVAAEAAAAREARVAELAEGTRRALVHDHEHSHERDDENDSLRRRRRR